MRCSYRCNMWCNCKKPVRHDTHVTGIGAPSSSEISIAEQSSSAVTFSYSPENASAPGSDIVLGVTGNAAEAAFTGFENGTASIQIRGMSVGSATVWYQIGEDTSTRQTISVTVEAQPTPEPFTPTNRIIVDVNPVAETRATKSKRGAKAEAIGDRFVARALAADRLNPNYVQLEWIHGETPSVSFMGTANNDHCIALFVEDVNNSLARDIEDYYDNGVMESGETQFNPSTYDNVIVPFFEAPLDPETTQRVINAVENTGVGVVDVTIDRNLSQTSGTIGSYINIYLMIPNGGGVMGDGHQHLEVTNTQRANEPTYNFIVTCQIIELSSPDEHGFTTFTYTSNNGNSDSIQIEYLPGLHIDSVSNFTPTGQEVRINGAVDPYVATYNYSPANAYWHDDVLLMNYDTNICVLDTVYLSPGYSAVFVNTDYPMSVGTITADVYLKGEDTGIDVTVEVLPATIPVESVSNLSSDSVYVEIGDYNSVTLDYLPVDANAYNNISFSHTNPNSIVDARVDLFENGTMIIGFYPNSIGNDRVIIELNGQDTGLYVDVEVAEQPIPPTCDAYLTTIETESVTVAPNGTATVSFGLGFDCADPTYGNISSISNDENVATVSMALGVEDGELTISGVSEGTTTIVLSDGTNSYYINVAVATPVYTVDALVNLPQSYTAYIGYYDTRHAYYTPANAANPQGEITITSSDTSIVEIDNEKMMVNGEIHFGIRGVSEGNANVVFTLANGNVYTIPTVSIVRPVDWISNISTNSVQLSTGNTTNVSFNYSPNWAGDFSLISVISNDENVATVTEPTYSNGRAIFSVVGVAEGTTTVEVMFNGTTTFSIDVEIVAPTPSPFVPSEHTMAYFPLSEDELDYSGNNVPLGVSGVQQSIGYGYYPGSGDSWILAGINDNTDIKFFSVWYKMTPCEPGDAFACLGNYGLFGDMQYNLSRMDGATYQNKIALWNGPGYNTSTLVMEDGMLYGAWHHYAWGYDGTNIIVAKDGVVSTFNVGPGYPHSNNFFAFKISDVQQANTFGADLSEIIVEDTCWSAQDITDYYYAIRDNYPYVEIDDIGFTELSYTVVETMTGTGTIEYTPTNAGRVPELVTLTSGDDNILSISNITFNEGSIHFDYTGVAEGTTTINVTCSGISVTVLATVTPFIHVSTIGGPSEHSVSVEKTTSYPISITIDPSVVSEISRDVTIYSDNTYVAEVNWADINNGIFNITGVDIGTTQVHYYLNSDPNTVYDVDVTVVPYRYNINENTRLYAPLENDFDGNSYTGSISYDIVGNSSNISFTTDQGVSYANFTKTGNGTEDGGFVIYDIGEIYTKVNQTAMAWVKPDMSISDWLVAWFESNWDNQGVCNASNGSRWFITHGRNLGDQFSDVVADGGWHLLTVTMGEGGVGGKIRVYLDGYVILDFMSWERLNSVSEVILGGRWINSAECGWNGGISDFIVEEVAWTPEQVANYYDATKDRYPSPATPVQSLTDIEQSLNATEGITTEYLISYYPSYADDVDAQISIVSDDDNIAAVSEGYKESNGVYHFNVYGAAQGQTILTYYLNGVSQGTSDITVAPFIHAESLGGPSENNVTLTIGSDYYISITDLYPASVTNISYDVALFADDSSVCSVDWGNFETGVISLRGNNAGTTQVHYYLIEDPSTVYDIDVTVRGPIGVEQVSNISQGITIALGETATVTAFDYLPLDADEDNVIFQNSNLVRFDWNYSPLQNGEYQIHITGQNEGSGNLEFYIDGYGTTYYIPITVYIPGQVNSIDGLLANSVSLAKHSWDASTIGFTYSPSDASNFDNLSFVVADDNICHVELDNYSSGTGYVYVEGLGFGTTTVSIYLDGVDTGYSFSVTVIPTPGSCDVEIISTEKSKAYPTVNGTDTVSFVLDYDCESPDTSNITVSSDDDNIATVAITSLTTSGGTITISGVSQGTTTVYISDNVNASRSIDVTVYPEGVIVYSPGDVGSESITSPISMGAKKITSVVFEGDVNFNTTWCGAGLGIGESSSNTWLSLYPQGGSNPAYYGSYLVEFWENDSQVWLERSSDLGYGRGTYHVRIEFTPTEVILNYGNTSATYQVPVAQQDLVNRVFMLENPDVLWRTTNAAWHNPVTVIYTTDRVPASTISAPDVNSLSIEQYSSGTVSFSYTPSGAETLANVTITSSDTTVATTNLVYSEGNATLYVNGVGAGNATISYYIDSDPLTVYTISVSVSQSSSPYTPTQSTIAYFPFKSDTNDYSGNGISANNNNRSVGDKGIIFSSGNAVSLMRDDIKFAGFWYKAPDNFRYDNAVEGLLWYKRFGEISYLLCHSSPSYINKICLWQYSDYTGEVDLGNMSFGEWHYFAWGVDSNGDLLVAKDDQIYTAVSNGSGYNFGNEFEALRSLRHGVELSDLIIDSASWDAQDMLDYYAATYDKYHPTVVTVVSSNDCQGTVSSNNIESVDGETGTVSGNTVTVSGTTVTATASPGFAFYHWEDGQGNTVSGTFTVAAGIEFVAYFVQTTPTEITGLSSYNYELNPGDTNSVEVYFSPNGGSDSNISATSSDTNVVNVTDVQSGGCGSIVFYFACYSLGTATLTFSDGTNTEVANISVVIPQHTVTFQSNDVTKGTVDVNQIVVDEGTQIIISDNIMTVGNTTVTATAESGYEFARWDLPNYTVDVDMTITAVFGTRVTSIGAPSANSVSIVEGNSDYSITFTYSPSDAIIFNDITFSTDDYNVANCWVASYNNGSAELGIAAYAAGNCTLTLSDGINTYTIAVTVTAPAPAATPTITGLSTNSLSIGGAGMDMVVYYYTPNDASDFSNITVTSDDSNVARGEVELYNPGVISVYGLSDGNCTLTISDGTNSYQVSVTVDLTPSPCEMDPCDPDCPDRDPCACDGECGD